MAQHLVSDLTRWKQVILMVRANAAESQGLNGGIKGLKEM